MSQSLKRSISFPMLLLFGLGTMVGGGIYALIGKVAGEAGMATPLAFMVSGILALVNAFTYSELASRYPVSAGEAEYVREAFKKKWASVIVGFLVIATGVVSAATLTVATIGFLQDVISFQPSIGIVIMVAAMAVICMIGVRESVWVVGVITIIEVLALIYVVIVGGNNIDNIPEALTTLDFTFDSFAIVGILSGAFLGFYAFIGFEDMANMAEEVKNARRNLPAAILSCVAITTILYIIVSTVSILVVPPSELAEASTPLAKVVGSGTKGSVALLIIVSILTGINGALVQIIMASRVLFGLGKRSKGLNIFSKVNRTNQIPMLAVLTAASIVLILALFLPLRSLAEITSGIILFLFGLLNLSLIKIKLDKSPVPEGSRTYSIVLPILGLLACACMLGFKFYYDVLM